MKTGNDSLGYTSQFHELEDMLGAIITLQRPGWISAKTRSNGKTSPSITSHVSADMVSFIFGWRFGQQSFRNLFRRLPITQAGRSSNIGLAYAVMKGGAILVYLRFDDSPSQDYLSMGPPMSNAILFMGSHQLCQLFKKNLQCLAQGIT